MKKHIILILTCLLAATTASATPFDEEALLSGQIQHRDDHTAVVYVKAAPDMVWQVLSDWEVRGEIMPGIAYARPMTGTVKSPSPGERTFLVESRLSVPLFEAQHTLHVWERPSSNLQEWRLATREEVADAHREGIKIRYSSSLIKRYTGRAFVQYHNGGALLTYTANVQSAMPLPAFIRHSLDKAVLEDAVTGIKTRAEQLAGAQSAE